MDIYPDMKVVIHEDEAEYIAGGKSYNTGEKASFSIQALTAIKALPGKEFKASSVLTLHPCPHEAPLLQSRPEWNMCNHQS